MRLRVYTAPRCPACSELKHELDAKGIEYEEVDVFKNADARARLEREGLYVVPVLEKDGKIIQVGARPSP